MRDGAPGGGEEADDDGEGGGEEAEAEVDERPGQDAGVAPCSEALVRMS